MLVQRFTLFYNGSCYQPRAEYPDFTPPKSQAIGPNQRHRPAPKRQREEARRD